MILDAAPMTTLWVMDQFQQLGARFRAVRIRRGWRQVDVGRKVGLDASVISRIERGHIERVQLGTILSVARALDIQVTLTVRSRGADLDRLISGRHAALHESVARWFDAELPDWILAPEVSFSIYGERGIIDIVAWHPGHRALVVIELKTDIVDVNELIGQMDQRRRLARQIAKEQDWDPLTISTWVIVANGRTNRARLAAHRVLLRNAFPLDGRSIRSWLRKPEGRIAALSLWQRVERGTAAGGYAARHRVRAHAAESDRGSDHEGLAPEPRNGRPVDPTLVREPVSST
jgi:transcriptional regulator with XRE-family HTH domain